MQQMKMTINANECLSRGSPGADPTKHDFSKFYTYWQMFVKSVSNLQKFSPAKFIQIFVSPVLFIFQVSFANVYSKCLQKNFHQSTKSTKKLKATNV
jgi:hypothetical protein